MSRHGQSRRASQFRPVAKRGNGAGKTLALCRPPQHVTGSRAGPASNSQAGLRAYSALAKLQPASRTPSHAKHSGIVRDHADHRCGGSAGIVSRGDSPDFPLIRLANLPALRAGQTARQKPDCDCDDNGNGGGRQGGCRIAGGGKQGGGGAALPGRLAVEQRCKTGSSRPGS